MATGSSDLKYLVLHVTEGKNFDCWRRLRLRIVSNLEKEWLMSNHLLAISNPILSIFFVWCLTQNHFKLLYKQKRQIQIGIVAEHSVKTWTAGCATIGVQFAQPPAANISLYQHKIPIEVMKSEGGSGLRPELLATLAIQTEVPVDKYAQIYISHLTEPLEALLPAPSTSGILKKNTAPTKKKRIKLDVLHEREASTQSVEERRQSSIAETSKTKITKNVRFQDEE